MIILLTILMGVNYNFQKCKGNIYLCFLDYTIVINCKIYIIFTGACPGGGGPRSPAPLEIEKQKKKKKKKKGHQSKC